MTNLNTTLAALANPARRQMLDQLLQGSKTVKELSLNHDMTAGAISQHLKVLEEAQLITRIVKGREHHCELAPDGLEPVLGWTEKHKTFWQQKLSSFDAFIHEQTGEKDNG
ncbi:HTH-type transcriptional regulator [Pseudovibrio axinellae]|uniref:HTH-type transcriptional regulator n=1 Tax=Pseudovibrio axinellae TaxID=989403 RepID=A0A166A4B9_9HYPH|nr:metalloregulator ArsR/SmtB family transcription factor [Pseudovibrio axinellae]KZL20612.1 HTH-type transcriptional regulator [Pseudovibrio axinellae]SER27902.1 transcriptional regulator, ArsR family [Pseudovibrio axinellae]